MKRFCCALLLAAVACSAQAATKGPLDVSKPAEQVTRQISAIRQDMGDGKTYVEIDPGKKAQAEAALSRISDTVTRAGGRELSQAEQVTVFNDQELVNTVLGQARDDSRMVCKRERAVGSNMMTSQCMTVAERRQRQRQSQKEMNDLQRNKSQLDPSGR